MIDREIKYNRFTKDFDCFVDSRYVGSRPNYRAGDELCNEIAFDLLEQGLVDEAPEPFDCAVCRDTWTCPDCEAKLTQQLTTAMAHLESEMANAEPLIADDPLGNQRIYITEQPLLYDIAQVLDMALGNAPAKDVIPNLRRVRQRLSYTV